MTTDPPADPPADFTPEDLIAAVLGRAAAGDWAAADALADLAAGGGDADAAD